MLGAALGYCEERRAAAKSPVVLFGMSGPPAGPNVAGVPVDPPQPVATAGGSLEAGAAPAAKGVLANQAEVSLADLSRAEGQLVGLLNTAAAILQVQRCLEKRSPKACGVDPWKSGVASCAPVCKGGWNTTSVAQATALTTGRQGCVGLALSPFLLPTFVLILLSLPQYDTPGHPGGNP